MKKLLLTGLSAACFFALGLTASAQNLVVNGDLETGALTPWNGLTNAVLENGGSPVVPGIVINGIYCFRFSNPTQPAYAASNTISVTPGHTYKIQFTGRVQTAIGPAGGDGTNGTPGPSNGVVRAYLRSSTDGGTTFINVPAGNFTPPFVTGTTTNTTVSAMYLVTAGVTNLILEMNKYASTTNAFGYADDISLIDQTVLPITLTSFTGAATNNGVTLNWATASESNNKSFTVLRSTNGQDFTQIGSVNGAGNSTTVTNYSFVDKTPANGANYYKLVQTDFDGKTESFTPISVKFNLASVTALSVYATQTKIQGQLNWVKNEQATVTVTDLAGKTVLSQKVNLQNGVNAINLSGAGLASSNLYVLTVSGSSATTSSKFYTN